MKWLALNWRGVSGKIIVGLLLAYGAVGVEEAKAEMITPISAHAWPNERPASSRNAPLLAIDGELDTFTYTTAAWNPETANLGLDFGRATQVNRIRLWKDDHPADGEGDAGVKDLTILFTNDPVSTPLASRIFQPVSGLTNGFQGTELMVATSVNANGTVVGDIHDSVNEGHGWASLSFAPVLATGIAIEFQGPENWNHYVVYEFEAYVPEPSTLILLTMGAIGLLAYVGRSDQLRHISSPGITLLLALCVVATAFPTQQGMADIIAQWHFDEQPGMDVAEASVGQVDGFLSGDADFLSGGISGNAVSMTQAGAGLVNMGQHFSFAEGDYSIVAWAKVAQGATNRGIFVGRHTSGHKNGYFLAINYNAPDKATFYESSDWNQEVHSTATVTDGRWHQIVAVYNAGGNAEIFVDGTPVEDVRIADPMVANTAPFLIGGIERSGTPRADYDGLVDEVQLYNHALASSDIQFLFENPSAIIPEPTTWILALIGLAFCCFPRERL